MAKKPGTDNERYVTTIYLKLTGYTETELHVVLMPVSKGTITKKRAIMIKKIKDLTCKALVLSMLASTVLPGFSGSAYGCIRGKSCS